MNGKDDRHKPLSRAERRSQRLEAELKANLKKRKEQQARARGRAGQASPSGNDDEQA